MANPGDFAYTLKQQADIVRVIGDYVKLKKAGAQNFSGLCPFHNEKTPSFSVHQTRQFFHCFGCGVSGDVFSFVQKIENITFPEAVRLVAQKLGVPMPKQHFDSPAEAREAKLRGALIELHEKACVFFEEQLRRPEGANAREYLKNRGLTDEAIKIFRIGYAPDSGFLLRDRFKGQYDEELLKASGLFSWKQTDEPTTNDRKPTTLYSKFRNRVMFPISNESAKIIAFTGRTLATDEKSGPKYLNSPETAIYSKGRVLYNLDRAKEAIRKLDSVILVEGQMDCISVFMAGQHNVIASSGTAFTEAQVRLLGRYTKRIIVNFDPDTAGAAAAERSLAMLVAEDFSIKVATLEPGFDPDLYVRKQGREAYIKVLQRAPRYFDYLIERALRRFPPHSPEAKVKAVNFLLLHIQQVPNRIVRDELANDIAQKLGIDSALLRQDLRHAAATRATSVKAPAEAQVTQAERIIIRALASSTAMSNDAPQSDRSGEDGLPDLWRQAEFTLSSEGLHRGLAAESLIEALLKAEPGADPMSLELSESDRRFLAATLMQEAQELTMELLEEALAALRFRQGLQRRQQEVKNEIAEAQRHSDADALGRLMQEKLRLDRELAARLRQ
jgi:DNA primase